MSCMKSIPLELSSADAAYTHTHQWTRCMLLVATATVYCWITLLVEIVWKLFTSAEMYICDWKSRVNWVEHDVWSVQVTCDEMCSSWTRPSLIVTRWIPIRDRACMCSAFPAMNSEAFRRGSLCLQITVSYTVCHVTILYVNRQCHFLRNIWQRCTTFIVASHLILRPYIVAIGNNGKIKAGVENHAKSHFLTP